MKTECEMTEILIRSNSFITSFLLPIRTTELYAKFPTEYKNFQKCLDYNDYRFYDCRKEERALHDCWNKEKKYTAVEQK